MGFIRACDTFNVLRFMFNLMVSARVGVIVLIIHVNRVRFAFSVIVCDLTVSPPTVCRASLTAVPCRNTSRPPPSRPSSTPASSRSRPPPGLSTMSVSPR